MITKADLEDRTGQSYPRDVLYCSICGTEYSANVGDYFVYPDSHIFRCCDTLMILVKKHCITDVVKE